MNAIRSVFTALANLAASLNGLASLVDTAAGRLRQQLALDETPPVIEHQPDAGNRMNPGNSGNHRKKSSNSEAHPLS